MNNTFNDLITTMFLPICSEFNLSVKNVSHEEVAVTGTDFVFLIWLDRDGISFKYVDFSDERHPIAIDIGNYLATQRQWLVDESFPLDGSFQAQIKCGLSSFSKTLRTVAPDILAGDKAWVSEASDFVMEFSDLHMESVQKALSKRPSAESRWLRLRLEVADSG